MGIAPVGGTGIYPDDLLGLVYCRLIFVAINEWHG
jgi:hypothetical protein